MADININFNEFPEDDGRDSVPPEQSVPDVPIPPSDESVLDVTNSALTNHALDSLANAAMDAAEALSSLPGTDTLGTSGVDDVPNLDLTTNDDLTESLSKALESVSTSASGIDLNKPSNVGPSIPVPPPLPGVAPPGMMPAPPSSITITPPTGGNPGTPPMPLPGATNPPGAQPPVPPPPGPPAQPPVPPIVPPGPQNPPPPGQPPVPPPIPPVPPPVPPPIPPIPPPIPPVPPVPPVPPPPGGPSPGIALGPMALLTLTLMLQQAISKQVQKAVNAPFDALDAYLKSFTSSGQTGARELLSIGAQPISEVLHTIDPFGGVATAFDRVVSSLELFDDNLKAVADDLRGISPVLAMSGVDIELMKLQGRMRQASIIGQDLASFEIERTRIEEDVREIKTQVLKDLIPIAKELLNASKPVISYLGMMATTLSGLANAIINGLVSTLRSLPILGRIVILLEWLIWLLPEQKEEDPISNELMGKVNDFFKKDMDQKAFERKQIR